MVRESSPTMATPLSPERRACSSGSVEVGVVLVAEDCGHVHLDGVGGVDGDGGALFLFLLAKGLGVWFGVWFGRERWRLGERSTQRGGGRFDGVAAFGFRGIGCRMMGCRGVGQARD